MSALGGIYAALKTLIAADAGVAALIASTPAYQGTNGKAVYDDGAAPQGGTLPFVAVGAGTEIPQSTFRNRGWNCTVQIKPVWQGTEATGQAIVTALSTLMMPASGVRALTVSGFASCWVDDFAVQPTLVTIQAGTVTREAPIILRVFAT